MAVSERVKLKLTNVIMKATKKRQSPAINICLMLVAAGWPKDVFKASSSVPPNRSKTPEFTNQLLTVP